MIFRARFQRQLKIDFGDLGIKNHQHNPQYLYTKKCKNRIVAVVNFPKKQIAKL
jgi:hypothetical protein